MLTPLERREINEGKPDRLLQLVGEFSGQNDPGDMGFDQIDAFAGMRIGAGNQQTLE